MLRYTLVQLFLAVTLIAIVLLFLQTEGCGAHFSVVESIVYTSDGKCLAVSKLDARDTKISSAEHRHTLARTLSWLDAETGDTLTVIDQKVVTDRMGAAHDLWKTARPALIWNTDQQRLLAGVSGEHQITSYPAYNEHPAQSEVISFSYPVDAFALSKSNRRLAAEGWNKLTILDTDTKQIVTEENLTQLLFGADEIAFLKQDAQIAMVSHGDIVIWDPFYYHAPIATLPFRDSLSAVQAASDDTLLICSEDWARRYDLTGKVLCTFQGAKDCEVACYSPNEMHVALASPGRVDLYQTDFGKRINSFQLPGVRSLAISPDGRRLATGDRHGQLTLVDLTTGQIQWSIAPPGHFRWPWTIPLGFLLAWLLAVVLLWWSGILKRSRHQRTMTRLRPDEIEIPTE